VIRWLNDQTLWRKVNMKTFKSFSAASIVLCFMALSARADAPLDWKPTATVEIPNSTGKFDFLRIDASRHRLLAAHENDGTADYIDMQKGTLIKRLKVGGPVDTAVDADAKLYYLSVQEGERVAVVDAGSLVEIKSIKVPGPTDAILYEPKNRMIYVTHDNGADVWVIDPASSKVVATIKIPGVPEFMVYDADQDRIYLNIKTKDTVAVIDPKKNVVTTQWPVGAAVQPHGLALDGANHRIFVAGGSGKLVVIDTKTGSISQTVDIASKVDQIAFDASSGFLYCAGADKMSVLQAKGAKVTAVGELVTAATAKNVAVDSGTRAVWTTYTDGKSSFAKSWVPPQP
jgi:YVTN family beta-propeller protein